MIPVLNKIDLPGAEPDRVLREIEEVIGLDCTNAIFASAKAGIDMDEILQGVVKYIPSPQQTQPYRSELSFLAHTTIHIGALSLISEWLTGRYTRATKSSSW